MGETLIFIGALKMAKCLVACNLTYIFMQKGYRELVGPQVVDAKVTTYKKWSELR